MRWLVPGLLPCLMNIAAGAATAAQPTMLEFKGICDASAAVALDDERIIVGDDEQPWLSIYSLAGGDSLSRSPLQGATGGEADLEGATVFDGRIVWISSNGRNSSGKVRPERFQLFASHQLTAGQQWTETFTPSFGGLPQAIALTTRKSYTPLRKAVGDLGESDEKLAPKKQGFNIEGLSVSRDGRSLLVGMRNPHPDGDALLFQIDNADALLDGTTTTAELGPVLAVDLGKRGIRDIAWWPARNAYLIAAGQTDDDEPGPGFALFTWDGASSPQEIKSFRDILRSNPDFHPEAMVPLLEASGGQLVSSARALVIGDDGTRPMAAGKPSKKLDDASKSFRAVVITGE